MRVLRIIALFVLVGAVPTPVASGKATVEEPASRLSLCEKTQLTPSVLPAETDPSQAMFEPVAGQRRTSQIPVAGAPVPYGTAPAPLPAEQAPRPTEDVLYLGTNMPHVPIAIRNSVFPDADASAASRDDAMAGSGGVWPVQVIPADASPHLSTQELVFGQTPANRQPQLQLASDATPVRSERCGELGASLAVRVAPEAYILVTANGFAAGETIAFWFGGDRSPVRIGDAAADVDGNVDDARVPLPPSVQPGVYDLSAVGQVSGRIAQLNFMISRR